MSSYVVDRNYWNIVKGIGIFLVVLGHINTPLTDYIYLFHMPFFFFISGFLYNEEKYGDNPYSYIASKIKSNWMKYVIIMWGFICVHNLFVKLQIAEPAAQIYTTHVFFNKLVEAALGLGSEFLAGPLWFVPVSVFTSCILGFVISISRWIEKKTKNVVLKYVFQFVTVTLSAVLGYNLMVRKYSLSANMHIVFLVLPFSWGGYLLRTVKWDNKKYLHPVIAVVFAMVLFLVNFNYKLELVLFMNVYPAMHLVAFFGIYMCIYLAKLMQSLKPFNILFDWSGRASFAIMASHYAIFRLFDWTMSHIFCPEDPITKYLMLPNSFPELKLVYLFIGYVVPLSVYVLCKKIRK